MNDGGGGGGWSSLTHSRSQYRIYTYETKGKTTKQKKY